MCQKVATLFDAILEMRHVVWELIVFTLKIFTWFSNIHKFIVRMPFKFLW